jgi:hypothetical protein
MASRFDHALNDDFIAKLEIESKKGWWADVLADKRLLIALRGDYLNVYWRGQSLFCVRSIPSGLKVTTHEKYLVDPALASQVSLGTDGRFEIEALKDKGFIPDYQSPKATGDRAATLAKMKRAAGLFSGLEKTGCHEIAVLNSAVIDVEITIPSKVSLDDGGKDKQLPRADLASLESDGDGKALLVFWEAKHYSNDELRAAGDRVPVLRQVEFYEKVLCERRREIEDSYTRVAKNLVFIKNKMRWERNLSPLMYDVASGKRQLTLGADPKIRLIIFGFDGAQKRDGRWQDHLKRLKEKITVLSVGDAKGVTLRS